jgi:hypothetical protein
MEIWRRINGFENLYKISTTGKIKSFGNGKSTNPNFNETRILKTTISKRGYERVKLFKDGKRYYFSVHRLVALNFLNEINGKNEVNHKDGNKANNNLVNLEWVSASENQLHAFKTGLQVAKKGSEHSQSISIRQIDLDGNVIKVWESIKQVKRELGFNTFGIIKCCKKEKKYNTAYKYKWEYV